MLDAQDTRPELPPIVLLVDEHRDELERYSRCFEGAGLWVAATAVAPEAVAAAEELNPDIVVADCDAEPAGAAALVEALKRHPSLGSVPFIVMTSHAGPVRSAADTVLVKPVSAHLLLYRTRELLSRTRAARGRAKQMIVRSEHAIDRAADAARRGAQLSAASQASRRLCPRCGGGLDWVEQAAVGGVTYDYYRWCLTGCALFCFDRDHDTWVKLG